MVAGGSKIAYENVRYAGAVQRPQPRVPRDRWWSTPDSAAPRANRARCCHLVIGLQVLPSLSVTLSLAESIEVSVVDNRLANQNFARPKGLATSIRV